MRRWTSRQRGVAVAVAVIVAFVVALVTYTRSGSDPAGSFDAGPGAIASTPGVGDPSTGVVTGPTSGSSGSSSAPASPTSSAASAGIGVNALPNLPEATDVNVNALPQHEVVISIRSDEPIAFVGYRVSYGRPASRTYKWATPPLRVQTVARGTGAVAAVIAQAGPYATTLTCSVSVDGRVRSTQTVTAAYRVVYCGA